MRRRAVVALAVVVAAAAGALAVALRADDATVAGRLESWLDEHRDCAQVGTVESRPVLDGGPVLARAVDAAARTQIVVTCQSLFGDGRGGFTILRFADEAQRRMVLGRRTFSPDVCLAGRDAVVSGFDRSLFEPVCVRDLGGRLKRGTSPAGAL